MKVLCLGLSTYDVIYPLDNFIKENTKNKISKRIECSGGVTNNVAYLLGKWGMDVYYAGCVGSDRHGKQIKHELELANVNTDYMETQNNMITPVRNIFLNINNKTSTALTYLPNIVEIEDIDIDFMPNIILIDEYGYEITKKILKKYPMSTSIMYIDNYNEDIKEVSKMVNFLICSKKFAEEVTEEKFDFNNSKTIISIYNKMNEIFNNNVIIKFNEEGTLYKYNNKIKLMPIFKTNIIDPTNLNDYFCGGFIYAISNDYNFDNSIKFANITGALSSFKIGSKNSTPNLDDVIKIYNEY